MFVRIYDNKMVLTEDMLIYYVIEKSIILYYIMFSSSFIMFSSKISLIEQLSDGNAV